MQQYSCKGWPAMRCYGFDLKLWSSALLSKQGAVDGAVMFSTIVIFPLHSRWQRISSGMKSPQAPRDLCLCSGTGEPEDMTCDCSPAERMEVVTHNQEETFTSEFTSLHVLYTHVRSGEHAYIYGPTACYKTFSSSSLLGFHAPPTHTSDATITAVMCTVHFKRLKGRFRKHVTHTCLLGNACSLHSDSSVTFSYVIRNSNQLRVSLPGNTLYPISCRCHVVGCLSLKFLLPVR